MDRSPQSGGAFLPGADYDLTGSINFTPGPTVGADSLPVLTGGDGSMQYAEVAISSAEIKALRATPKTLVAAPGAGKALVFRQLVLLLDATATAYTETADNMAVKYENGAGDAASQTIEATGFIDQTTDQLTVGLPVIDPIVAKAIAENKPLVLHNTGDGEYAVGTGVLRAKVWYSVITTGW